MSAFPDDELEVTFFRASGPGGQHRNRRETGVRIRHLPTGIVVTATERRSQADNRAAALERLAEALARLRRKRKRRVPTRATRASVERRIETKKRRADVKKGRGRIEGA
ncbi:MAG: peptide chain release factor-like protein [Deferrisomatales bacterium]